MSFKVLKGIILASASSLLVSCSFNTVGKMRTTNPSANERTLSSDSIHKTLDKDGALVSIERYTNGSLNDGPNGEPAYQGFTSGGVLVDIEHDRNGQLNDGANGAPALQQFSYDGVLYHEEHYRNDQRNDGVNGEPAIQDFDDSGKLTYASRYKNDVFVRSLSAREMADYQKNKNVPSKMVRTHKKNEL
jgi:hypothetical protein